MRQKRVKQIKKLLHFTGHDARVNDKGQKLISNVRRFKKMYARDRPRMIETVNRMQRMMDISIATDAARAACPGPTKPQPKLANPEAMKNV